MKKKAPPQSTRASTRFPGSSIAARDLGVSRTQLHAVLSGKRESKSLLSRWNAWLKANPEFLKANQEKRHRSQGKSTPAEP